MKRFFSFLAAAAMLFTASCSNEDLGTTDGEEAVVSFSMNLEGASATKAIGDGTTVNKLVYSVFQITKDENGVVTDSKYLTTVDPEGQETFPYTTEIRLAKNKNYRVVFWAQNDECGAYSLNKETMEITVAYDGLNNDEKRDAFYAYKDLKITGSVKEDITLERPFAQLNVGVTAEDWNAAVTSNATVEQSMVTVKKVANSMNLFNGKIGNNTTDVTYEYAAIPNNKQSLGVDLNGDKDTEDEGEQFYYLSMSYLLVEKNDVSVDFLFKTNSNEIDFSIATVPVERNHRTNIIGQILTGNVRFDIKIDAEFKGNNNFNVVWSGEIEQPRINENGEYIIMTGANLAWLAHATNGTLPTGEAANTFAGKTFKLVNNIDLGNYHWTPIGYWATFEGTFDGQGYTISNLKHHGTEADCYVGLFGNTVNATIKNLTINNVDIKLVADNSWAGGHVGALIGHIEENVTIENVTIKGLVEIDGALDKAGAGRIGGVVGGNNDNAGATFRNVHVIADERSFVKGNNAVGGIAGQIFNGTLIFENCSSNIDVTAQQFYAGGIIGMASINTKLTNCSTSGDITVVAGRAGKVNDLYRVGGIVGCWGDNLTYPLVLENCSYTGKVVGPADEKLDCAGYVGRGYQTKVGAVVIVNGTEYKWNGNGYDITGKVNDATEMNAALADGYAVINIMDNVDNGTNSFSAGNSVIINMNNNEVKAGGTANSKAYGYIFANNEVVINDANMVGGGIAMNNTKFTFNGGTQKVNYSGSSRYAFYVVGNSEVVIEDGKFVMQRTSCPYFYIGAGSTVYIKGGEFVDKQLANDANKDKLFFVDGGNLIITGGKFQKDPSEWVAVGYVATKDSNNHWVVTKQ